MKHFVLLLFVAVTLMNTGSVSAEPPEADVYYRIRNVNSKKYLALGDGATKNDHTQVVQRVHGQDERQQWKFVAVGKFYKIINRKTEQELNVRSKEEDDEVVASNNGKNAQWSLEKSGEYFSIKSRNSGYVVDVADESKERKAPIVQYRFVEGRNQLFILDPVK